MAGLYDGRAAASSVGKLHLDLAALVADGLERQRHVVGEVDVFAGGNVEAITVEGAGDDAVGQVALSQGQAGVGADVFERTQLAVDLADHQRRALGDDADFAALGELRVLGDVHPFAHDRSHSVQLAVMQEFSRYRKLVCGLAKPALEATARAAALSRERLDAVTLGVPAARLLLSEDPLLYPALGRGFAYLAARTRGGQDAPMLADSFGHKREVYDLLVLHLHLAAFLRRYETMPVEVWSVCEDALAAAVAPARRVEVYATEAPDADHVTPVLWKVLCLFEAAQLASRDADIEWADGVVHHIVNRPGQGSSLHPQEPGESIELWTYRELSGLHALANMALRRRSESWSKRVEQIALYHLEHTQPDFTTSQPWGVFGFFWSPRTRSFADQQIHDAATEGGGTLNPLAAMLLADAADALATFG